MRNTTLSILILSVIPVLSVACKQDESTSAPGVSADAAPPATDAEDDEDANQAKVSLDPRIAEMCGITEPTFDFDSTKLSKQAKATLDTLASCFIEGNAKGHNMSLVGHADPRGSEDYNFGLGQRRSGNVGGYLAKRGLGDDRVATSSRGELDATGTSEPSWIADRRVEILLAD